MMKMSTRNAFIQPQPCNPLPPAPPHGPLGHMPPHEKRALLNVEFEQEDLNRLQEIFGDEDAAAAALQIIQRAPAEMQLFAIQLMVRDSLATNTTSTETTRNVPEVDPDMDISSTRFPNPVLDEQAQQLYGTLYGALGSRFVTLLNNSPEEVAVVSKMIASLVMTKGG